MSLITIKQLIETSLPSNNQIPITVLVNLLKALADDWYSLGLTEENFTTVLLNKLNGIADGAEVNPTSHEIAFINGLSAALALKVEAAYVNNQIDAAINALIGTAPGTLDTLAEIATAINNDEDVYTNLINLIATKGSQSTKELFTATASQTTFVLSSSPNNVDVYVDRVQQIETIDYNLSIGNVVMTTGLEVGSKVVIRKY